MKDIEEMLKQLTHEQIIKALFAAVSENQQTDVTVKRDGVVVNDDFTVVRGGDVDGRNSVRAGQNQWVDEGYEDVKDLDPSVYATVKTENRDHRPPPQTVTKKCCVCSRSFEVRPDLVCGENIRCNRCTGR